MEVQESVIHKSSRIRNLKCDICKKMYASKDVLRKHIKSVHFKDGFVCTKCNVKFDQKRKLDFHMQQHNNESMFSEQDSSVYIQGNEQDATIISKDPLSAAQYDLLTDNIGDALFANLFTIKKM